MKKNFLLAIGINIAVSFLGVQFVLAIIQTVPVTKAQSTSTQSTISQVLWMPYISGDMMVTAVPLAEATITNPAAAVATAEAITKTPTNTERDLLAQFIESVSARETELVTGVYIPDKFSVAVVQQPGGNSGFVSTKDETVTQFAPANVYGTIGLLAHNYLSGKLFFDLREGDEVIIVFGNGSQEHYRINLIERYQALSPTSVYSDFINLSDPNRVKITANQVFQRVYTKENRVVLQTCIEANGNSSWGRLFVIAEKIN
jgi:hypothetical protein